MHTKDKTGNGDKRDPNDRHRQRELSRRRPDADHAEGGSGRKCRNDQRMPAGKAGTPIPFRVPQRGARSADSGLDEVDHGPGTDDGLRPGFDAR